MSVIWAVIDWMQLYGIVAMVAVFVAIFVTTYWPGRKASVERHGLIPLEDDRVEAGK